MRGDDRSSCKRSETAAQQWACASVPNKLTSSVLFIYPNITTAVVSKGHQKETDCTREYILTLDPEVKAYCLEEKVQKNKQP